MESLFECLVELLVIVAGVVVIFRLGIVVMVQFNKWKRMKMYSKLLRDVIVRVCTPHGEQTGRIHEVSHDKQQIKCVTGLGLHTVDFKDINKIIN